MGGPMQDPAVDTLLRAWRTHGASAGPIVFLGARPHPGVAADLPEAAFVQRHAAWAGDLRDLGLEVQADATALPAGSAAHVLVLPDRQQQRARAELATAIRLLAPGGTLWCCAPTREGGKRHPKTLAPFLDDLEQDSKARCRVVWGARAAEIDDAALDAMLVEDAPREILDGWQSRPGVFSWEEPDPGSRMLARHLPTGLEGVVVDLGAGWGWLTASLLQRCPGITEVHAIEADADAVALGRVNLASRTEVPVAWHWADATRPLPVRDADVVVCNPPFHIAGKAVPALGQAFLAAAASVLGPTGQAWFVANRTLPYEAELERRFARVRIAKEEGRYKVLHAWAPRRSRAR